MVASLHGRDLFTLQFTLDHGLAPGKEGVLPSAQGRSRHPHFARDHLQVLTAQQTKHGLLLAAA
ncbi:hypothetical protein [Gluconacetobacter sacchari]|uniref:hypothetical protein n=1 Tax=Gluconacetobacter sacchari TaxID=92759 RepID=UPI003570B538